MRKFVSSVDQFSYIITYFVIGLTVLLLIRGVNSFKASDRSLLHCLISFWPLLLAGTVIAMYLLRPVCVIVDNSGITIDRKIKPVVIPFSEIRRISPLQKSEMSSVMRTFGNGGVYGYTGRYYNKTVGTMTWYCTQRKNYVLIEKTNKKKIIITPDDPEGLIQAVREINPAIVTDLTGKI